MPDKNYRHKSIRLPGYDYSQPGTYFITICAHQKALIFGEIRQGTVQLSRLGELAQQGLGELSRTFTRMHLDAFVVMPNHIHLLNEKDGDASPNPKPGPEAFGKPVAGSIPTIVRMYKASVIRKVNMLRDRPPSQVWHRNYYEHVVRTEQEKELVYAYIVSNPARWDSDEENPAGPR